MGFIQSESVLDVTVIRFLRTYSEKMSCFDDLIKESQEHNELSGRAVDRSNSQESPSGAGAARAVASRLPTSEQSGVWRNGLRSLFFFRQLPDSLPGPTSRLS